MRFEFGDVSEVKCKRQEVRKGFAISFSPILSTLQLSARTELGSLEDMSSLRMNRSFESIDKNAILSLLKRSSIRSTVPLPAQYHFRSSRHLYPSRSTRRS